MQGRNSTGLIVRKYDDYHEIIWGQKFDDIKVNVKINFLFFIYKVIIQ